MSTRTTHTVDFSKLPDVSRTWAWLNLDDVVHPRMSRFPETEERAICSATFAWKVIGDNGNGDIRLRQGYMRAALSEFVGMEEALARDLAMLGIDKNPIRANDCPNPVLHIVRELRNFEIHLHSSQLSPNNINVLWGSGNLDDKHHEMDITIYAVDDLKAHEIKSLKSGRYYDDHTITVLVMWFNAAQKEWGVHHLILCAIKEYCAEIVGAYQ